MPKNDVTMNFKVKDNGTIVIKNASKKMRAELEKTARKAKTTSTSMTNNFKKVAGALAGVTIAVVAVHKAMSAGKSIIDYGDTLNKMNLRLGISVKMLDKLKKVGALAGVSLSNISTSLIRMQRNIDMARKGTGEAADTFKELGIDINKLIKMSPEDQFLDIAEAIDSIEDPTLKSAAANKILGRSGVLLISMFKNLRGELDKTKSSFDDEKARKMAEFNDELQRLRDVLVDVFVDNSDQIVGGATKLASALIKLASAANLRSISGTYFEAAELDKEGKLGMPMDEWRAKSYTDRQSWVDERKMYGDKHGYNVKKRGMPRTPKTSRTSEGSLGGGKSGAATSPEFTSASDLEEQIRIGRENDAVEAAKKAKELKEEAVKDAKEIAAKNLAWRQQIADAEIEIEDAKYDVLRQYAKDHAQMAEHIQSNITNEMTDGFMAMADGSKSAGEAFKDMAKSIISDLMRMIVQQQIFNALQGASSSEGLIGKFATMLIGGVAGGAASGGLAGTGATSSVIDNSSVFTNGGPLYTSAYDNVMNLGKYPSFAGGGYVDSPTLAMVGDGGEREWMVGDSDMKKMAGSSNIVVNNNITFNGDSGTKEDQERASAKISKDIEQRVKQVIAQQMRFGGQLNTSGRSRRLN